MVGALSQLSNTEHIVTNKGQLLQDPFLNALRREHVPVSIYLVNGIKPKARSSPLTNTWFF